MPRLLITLSLTTRPPPLARAPIASSCHCGTPSLRTRNTSSGARSAAATSHATGTPPRASPRTSRSSAALDRPPAPEPGPGPLRRGPGRSVPRFAARAHSNRPCRMSSRFGDCFSLRRAIQLRVDSESLTQYRERNHGHRIREHRRPPAGRGVRLAHQAGRDAAAGSAVAADDGGGRDRVARRRHGGARPARRAALGRPARSRRVRPAAPVRRRAVVGGAAISGRPGSSAGGGTPTSSSSAPGGGTRVHDEVDTTIPGAALRPTFVYRHRQLADDLAAHRDAAEAGAKPMVVAVTGASGSGRDPRSRRS